MLGGGDGGRLAGWTEHGQTAFPCLDGPGGAHRAAAAIGDAVRGATGRVLSATSLRGAGAPGWMSEGVPRVLCALTPSWWSLWGFGVAGNL